MKLRYEKPVLIAESYTFSDSVAKCEQQIGTGSKDALLIYQNTQMCAKDGGHVASKGVIATSTVKDAETGKDVPKYTFPLTIFNDGEVEWDNSLETPVGCDYDWNGSAGGTLFGQTITGNFGDDWFGATADNDNHRPAYNGVAFFS